MRRNVSFTGVLCAALCLFANSCRSSGNLDSTTAVPDVAPLWQTDLRGDATGLAAPLILSGRAIVGAGRSLSGLDPATGAQRWTIPVPFGLPYAGLVGLDSTTAALVTGDGFIVFNPRSGAVSHQWTEPQPRNRPIQATPQVLSDERIVYASRSRDLLALNTKTGQLDTLVRLPGDSARASYVTSLSIWNDTIYAPVSSYAARGARYRNIVPYRIDATTRHLDSLKSDPSDSASLTTWMLISERLLISATDYEEASWIAFDRQTGERRWQVLATRGSLGPSSQVAVVGDTMFAGGNDGTAYVIHMPTGRLLRTMPIPKAVVNGVVACGSNVIINALGATTIYARDGTQRRGLRGIPEGRTGFLGFFGSGEGIAVIGNGFGEWTAFACPPPS
jgi:outer membrane protein assembly factor BamB